MAEFPFDLIETSQTELPSSVVSVEKPSSSPPLILRSCVSHHHFLKLWQRRHWKPGYLSPRHFPLERKGISAWQFRVNPQIQRLWALHQALGMPSHKARALHSPSAAAPALPSYVGPKLIQVKAPRGCNCGIETVPYLPSCSESWRQLSPSSLSWL